MKQFIMHLKAEEPLVLTSGSSEGMAHKNLGYIPSNMLLGAFASSWKHRHAGVDPDTDSGFIELFLNGNVSWGNATPMCGDDTSIPVPLSYMREKNKKGLPSVHEPAGKHRTVNLLRCDETSTLKNLLGNEGEAAKLKNFGSAFMGKKTLRLYPDRQHWDMHVALGTQRSAVKGQLFGYNSIAASTTFICEIICKTDKAEQELQALLQSVKTLHVGHSRSAGYGKISITLPLQESTPAQNISIKAQTPFAVYLRSHYIPTLSWFTPFDSLQSDLNRLCGESVEITKAFCAYTEIQGYNALWKKPRTSRMALTQGSVLLCVCDTDINISNTATLGGSRVEGFGRIMINPSFLEKPLTDIPALSTTKNTEKKSTRYSFAGVENYSPPCVGKKCEERFFSLLLTKEWESFLISAGKNTKPSKSQRGNIRKIVTELPHSTWKEQFKILRKNENAREQWEYPVCYNPYTQRKDFLAAIMDELLDTDSFGKKFMKDISLPGGPASEDEKKEAQKKMHTVFMLRLLSKWGHKERLNALTEK